MERPRLGPFDLIGPIASGGMAEVWEGRHPGTDTLVAIKVLAADAADDHRRVSSLEREVRAVAALEHPSIVWVHDAGRVPEAVAQQVPELVADRPWFAMELARGGTLQHRLNALRWPEIERIVLDLLSALGHAHARGLLHRDIKPSNILFRSATSSTPVLADFGMASQTRRVESTPGGTPAWMPPEQILDDVDAQGPWTDLYSLGLVVWAMVTGRRPFRGSVHQLVQAHLHQALPDLEPRFPIPPELGAWIGRLTEKDPEARFDRAIDAARALKGLGEPSPVVLRQLWNAPVARRTSMQGAGLGLFRLRERPVVGREQEQRELWDHLMRVVETRRSRVVVVHGPEGTGKSRLAHWVARRAHELGVAETFEATFHQPPEPGDGLAAMLRRALHLRSDDEFAVRSRLSTRLFGAPLELVEDAAGLLTERILPGMREHEVVCQTLSLLAGDRVSVVVLDDADLSPETLDLLLAGVGASHPILYVATSRTPLNGFRSIWLGSLPRDRWKDLADSLLPLESVLARTLMAEAAGHPALAERLVGRWIEAGLHDVAGEGFQLPEGVLPPRLPESTACHRADALASRPAWTVPLLLAAIRSSVPRREWDQACERLGARAPAELIHRLLVDGVGELTPDGFRIVDVDVRQALERRAALEGRLAMLHAAWADAFPVGSPARGEHLVGAGRLVEAVDALWEGARAVEGVDPAEARRLLRIRHAHLPIRGDARRVEGMCELSGLANAFGDPAASVRWAMLAVEEARGARLEALARWRLGAALLRSGEAGTDEALSTLDEALVRSRRAGDGDLTAKVLRTMARANPDPSVRIELLCQVAGLPGVGDDTGFATQLDLAVAIAQVGRVGEARARVSEHLAGARERWSDWGAAWYAFVAVWLALELDDVEAAAGVCASFVERPGFLEIAYGTVCFLRGEIDEAERHFERGHPYDGGVGAVVVAAARGRHAEVDALRAFVGERLRTPRVTQYLVRWLAATTPDPGLRAWAERLERSHPFVLPPEASSRTLPLLPADC